MGRWFSTLALPILALCSGGAHASFTTWTFAGEISGSITLDLSALHQDPVIPNTISGAFSPPFSNPLQVSGQASNGLDDISVGGGGQGDFATMEITRDGGIGGQNALRIRIDSVYDDFHNNQIWLIIVDFLGSNSNLFTDPNGGFDPLQGINWNATGADIYAIIGGMSLTGHPVREQLGRVTSVEVATSVPEPGTLVLAGVALLGLVAARRRRQA